MQIYLFTICLLKIVKQWQTTVFARTVSFTYMAKIIVWQIMHKTIIHNHQSTQKRFFSKYSDYEQHYVPKYEIELEFWIRI